MTTTKRVYGEEIELKELSTIERESVDYEMSYSEGNRFVMIHILWSALVFIISLLI